MARIAGVDLRARRKSNRSDLHLPCRPRNSAGFCDRPTEQRIRDLNDSDVNRLRRRSERFSRRGRAAHRDHDEHQAAHGHWQLPRDSSPPWSTGSRPAYAHQRPYQEGSTPRNRRQEESHQISGKTEQSWQSGRRQSALSRPRELHTSRLLSTTRPSLSPTPRGTRSPGVRRARPASRVRRSRRLSQPQLPVSRLVVRPSRSAFGACT